MKPQDSSPRDQPRSSLIGATKKENMPALSGDGGEIHGQRGADDDPAVEQRWTRLAGRG